MPQIPLSLAMNQLERAGYSKSPAHEDRIIVTRGRLTWSFAVLGECVARDRITQLLDLAASQRFRPQPDRWRPILPA
jgi:hypothetical protein